MTAVWMILPLCLLLVLLSLLIRVARRKNGKREGLYAYYAHRGLHDLSIGVPENSLAAFKRAKEHGYGVELDVQLTKDGKLVVFHDKDLLRMCGIDRLVSECTYEELLHYRLANTDQTIPLYSEVLDLLGERVPILCEIKVHGKATDTSVSEAALPYLLDHSDHTVVESFNPFALKYIREHAPNLLRGQLSCDFSKSKGDTTPLIGFIMKHLLLNFLVYPDFIAYRFSDARVSSFLLVKSIFRPHIVAWTVRSNEEEDFARKHGFTSIIFENYLPNK